MAQIKFSDCIGWKTHRPYMVPVFTGGFTPVESSRPTDWCRWADPKRRSDMVQTYGSGNATLNSSLCDVWGVPSGTASSYRNASTLEGTLKLPVDVQEMSFNPTIGTLDFLTHSVDTRLQPTPIKYYR